MPFIDRDGNKQIVGLFASSQRDKQEYLAESNAAVVAFRTRRTKTQGLAAGFSTNADLKAALSGATTIAAMKPLLIKILFDGES